MSQNNLNQSYKEWETQMKEFKEKLRKEREHIQFIQKFFLKLNICSTIQDAIGYYQAIEN